MRSFSKKLAFVLAAAMVVTGFAPAAQAKAADEMAINKSSQILYVNEGINHKGNEGVPAGKGNVSVYDFSVKNKPSNWKTAYSFAWSSSNEDVVTVKAGGVATAVGVGKATVYCKVTEKATKKVTTLKTAVEVKENAAKVAIKNADKYDGTTVEVNGVVDLDRVMYNAAGKSTTKKGTLVTDCTRWVAEPSKGVEINQSNGKFTFTEEAEAGDYTLYCETYQSSKYTKTTATSEPVVVTLVKAKTFDVVQNSTTKLTVTFSSKSAALNVADVTVNKMIGEYKYPQTVKSVTVAEDGMSATIDVFNSFIDSANYVISVKGYEDNAFVASVGTPVRMEIIAVGKNPAFVLTTSEQATIKCLFYDANGVDVTNADNYEKRVSYKLEKTATNGDFYLAGSKLTIKKNTVSAVVLAKYLGKLENGKYVGALEARREFIAQDAAAVVPVSVKAFEFDGDWDNGWSQTALEVGEQKQIQVRLNHNINNATNGYGWASYTNNSGYNNNNTKEKITITAITPDIADITYAGVVRAHKPGVAQFYLNYTVKQADGKWLESPFAIIEVTVNDVAIVSELRLSAYDIVVGTADITGLVTKENKDESGKVTGTYQEMAEAQFDQSYIDLYALDQRGGRINMVPNTSMYKRPASIELKCLSDGYGDEATMKALANAIDIYKNTYYGDGQGKDCLAFKVEGSKLRNILIGSKVFDTNPNNGEVASLLYEATFTTAQDQKLSVTFSVTVQEPGDPKDNYIQVNPNSGWIDLTRVNDPNGWMKREEKTITFDVFEMNNGIIVDTVDVTPFDKKTAKDGSYQFQILKDGQEVNIANVKYETSNTNGNWWMEPQLMNKHRVIVHPTTVEYGNKALNAAVVVTGGAVLPDYSKGGAGLYTFALYKWQLEDGELIAVQQLAVDVTAVVNSAGEYTLNRDAQNSNHVEVKTIGGYGNYSAADAKKILECFTIKDANNNDVVKTNDGVNFFVNPDKNYKYYVDYSAPSTADYVYVKEIIFYEEITTSGDTKPVYVPFVVSVDVSLENR